MCVTITNGRGRASCGDRNLPSRTTQPAPKERPPRRTLAAPLKIPLARIETEPAAAGGGGGGGGGDVGASAGATEVIDSERIVCVTITDGRGHLSSLSRR